MSSASSDVQSLSRRFSVAGVAVLLALSGCSSEGSDPSQSTATTGDVLSRLGADGLGCPSVEPARDSSIAYLVPENISGDWYKCGDFKIAGYTGGGWALLLGVVNRPTMKQVLDCDGPGGVEGAAVVSDGVTFIAMSGVTQGKWSMDLPPEKVAEVLGGSASSASALCASLSGN